MSLVTIENKEYKTWIDGRTTQYLFCWKDGKNTLVHRAIMEEHLNRKLLLGEVVHYINGNSFDNKITNLEIVDHAEHTRFHQKEIISCEVCGKLNDGHFAKGLCGKHYHQRKKGIV